MNRITYFDGKILQLRNIPTYIILGLVFGNNINIELLALLLGLAGLVCNFGATLSLALDCRVRSGMLRITRILGPYLLGSSPAKPSHI